MHFALKAAGREKVFVEKASGAQRDRPELRAGLEYVRAGDTLVVWKLDRLARPLKQLIESVEMLAVADRGDRRDNRRRQRTKTMITIVENEDDAPLHVRKSLKRCESAPQRLGIGYKVKFAKE